MTSSASSGARARQAGSAYRQGEQPDDRGHGRPRRNPFVGPRSFETGERLFGRDRETRELFGLLVSERIVLLHSPSGAGKTSLLQAALVPLLRRGGLPGLADDPRQYRTGGGRPNRRCARPVPNRYVLSALRSLEKGLPAERAIPPERPPRDDALRVLRHERRALGRPRQVLIFDQFEEVLTVAPNDLDGEAGSSSSSSARC